MTTKPQAGQTLSGTKANALPLRRSARQQPKNLPIGSSSQPIIIPDSSPPRLTHVSKKVADSATSESAESIQTIPDLGLEGTRYPSKLQGISGNKKLDQLIRDKQAKLLKAAQQDHGLGLHVGVEENGREELKGAMDTTLVFAQEEAGTAICISPQGHLLTCAHCVAESPSDLDLSKIWTLLFSSGRIVQAKTVRWDEKRDLALLKITGAQVEKSNSQATETHRLHSSNAASQKASEDFKFPSIKLVDYAPKVNAKLLCIGHPGSEDLEVETAGVETGYDVLHVSEGRFRGYAKGQDRQDNSEIGALRHDCWTYWGHSGAPLVQREGREGGRLVGLHSSWDDETGMRRGVGWEALTGFLGECEGMGLLSRRIESVEEDEC